MNTQLINKLQLTGSGVISIIGAGGKTSLMFKLAKQLADSGKTVLTTTTTKIFRPKSWQSPFTIIENSIDQIVEKSAICLKDYAHFSAGSHHDLATGKLKGFAPNIIDHLWQAGIFDWIIIEADGARQKPIKATASHEPVVPGTSTHLILVAGLDAVGKPFSDEHVHRFDIFSKNTGLTPGKTIDEKSMAAFIDLEIKKAGSLGNIVSNSVFLNKADNFDKINSGQKIADLLKTNEMVHRVITASLIDELPVKHSLMLKKI